jgi:hypothetical protein
MTKPQTQRKGFTATGKPGGPFPTPPQRRAIDLLPPERRPKAYWAPTMQAWVTIPDRED